jgi:hypothetical protein
MCPARFNVAAKVAWPGGVGWDSGQHIWTWVAMELLCLRCCNKHPFAIVSDFISISRMVGLDSLVPRAHA